MKVVSIAAGCVGLVGVMCATTTLAADVPSSFIQQEAARADASLRQRAEAPMARAALSRSESSYDNLMAHLWMHCHKKQCHSQLTRL